MQALVLFRAVVNHGIPCLRGSIWSEAGPRDVTAACLWPPLSFSSTASLSHLFASHPQCASSLAELRASPGPRDGLRTLKARHRQAHLSDSHEAGDCRSTSRNATGPASSTSRVLSSTMPERSGMETGRRSRPAMQPGSPMPRNGEPEPRPQKRHVQLNSTSARRTIRPQSAHLANPNAQLSRNEAAANKDSPSPSFQTVQQAPAAAAALASSSAQGSSANRKPEHRFPKCG